jgi:hypothetical protein
VYDEPRSDASNHDQNQQQRAGRKQRVIGLDFQERRRRYWAADKPLRGTRGMPTGKDAPCHR